MACSEVITLWHRLNTILVVHQVLLTHTFCVEPVEFKIRRGVYSYTEGEFTLTNKWTSPKHMINVQDKVIRRQSKDQKYISSLSFHISIAIYHWHRKYRSLTQKSSCQFVRSNCWKWSELKWLNVQRLKNQRFKDSKIMILQPVQSQISKIWKRKCFFLFLWWCLLLSLHGDGDSNYVWNSFVFLAEIHIVNGILWWWWLLLLL